MKARIFFLSLFIVMRGWSQSPVASLIDDLNKKADRAVVEKNIPVLQEIYADDFVFTHGTGLIDSKGSWIENIRKENTKFISRDHDSTLVELHDNVAIVTGRLLISRQSKEGLVNYGLRYVRVFALKKKRWQMISHRTVKEWHY